LSKSSEHSSPTNSTFRRPQRVSTIPSWC